jgi:hypothetical protein
MNIDPRVRRTRARRTRCETSVRLPARIARTLLAAAPFLTVLIEGACVPRAEMTSVRLPGGKVGIDFDELRYSKELNRVLVPAGRTGNLVLLDPDALTMSTVGGFSAIETYDERRAASGVTSVDAGAGLLFVTDRSNHTLSVVDPKLGSIVGSTTLSSEPGYVRYAAATHELWVTEPHAGKIEIFTLNADARSLSLNGTVSFDHGPMALVIDKTLDRAYAHRHRHSTVVIDLRSRAVIAEWPNGCAAPLGIALDESRGFLIASCRDGIVSVLDVRNRGRILSSTRVGSGHAVIDYDAELHHLFLVDTSCGCVRTYGISVSGELDLLTRHYASNTARCVVADATGAAWVCDPARGQLLRFRDSYPSSF